MASVKRFPHTGGSRPLWLLSEATLPAALLAPDGISNPPALSKQRTRWEGEGCILLSAIKLARSTLRTIYRN